MDIVREHAGENVLIVSHKATIRLSLCSLLGFDPRRYRIRSIKTGRAKHLDVRGGISVG